MNSFRFIFIFLLILSGCKDKDPEPRFEPTDVLVGIKTEYTIDKVFDLINQANLEVEYIEYSYYRSSLPSDSLQYVLDYLNTRPYDVVPFWFTLLRVIKYLKSQFSSSLPIVFSLEGSRIQIV
jgi:hypothetical protein